MTFPTVVSVTETTSPDNTSHNVAIDPGDSGDLHIACLSKRGAGGMTGPAGWTELGAHSTIDSAIFAIVDDGALSSPVTVSIPSGEPLAAQVFHISGWRGSLDGVELSTNAEGSNDNPNANSLTVSWGAADNLFLAITLYSDDAETISSYPTGYSDGLETTEDGGVNASASVGSARLESTAATEDAGGFVLDANANWVAWTVGIRPSSGQEADATAGALPAVQYKAVKNLTDLAGGLPAVETQAAKFEATAALAGGLASVTVNFLGAGVTVNDEFLLLEDDLCYLLQEDNSSKIQIGEGSDAISIEALSGALAEIQIQTRIMSASVVAGVAAALEQAATRFIDAAATAGGLATQASQQFYYRTLEAVSAGLPGIIRKHFETIAYVVASIPTLARKTFISLSDLAGGLVNVVEASFGSGVTLISIAAQAGGLPTTARFIKRTFSVVVGGIATNTASFLQFAAEFIGGMGLGSVSRPGGGWRSWKTKSRR